MLKHYSIRLRQNKGKPHPNKKKTVFLNLLLSVAVVGIIIFTYVRMCV